MSKTFFIIPGFKQKPTAKSFDWLREFLSKRGLKVVVVPIKWNYHVMSDWVKEFTTSYNTHKTDINYILGFSYGAVIALLVANILKPEKIFLCSLSSDFKEDKCSRCCEEVEYSIGCLLWGSRG
jgi:predicted alpha/beta hydrolase family esterase